MTEDWSKFDLDSYIARARETLRCPSPEQEQMFYRNIYRWAEIYQPFYTQLRAEICKIAAENHSAVGCDQFVNRYKKDFNDFGRDDILLITDDDDWYHPDIVKEVTEAFEANDVDVVYWDNWMYKTIACFEDIHIHRGTMIGSNGFAIRGGLKDWGLYCTGAHVHIERTMDRDRMLYLPKALSVWNVNPCSFWINQNFPLNESFHQVDRRPHPPEIAWAEKEMGLMCDLVTSVKKVHGDAAEVAP